MIGTTSLPRRASAALVGAVAAAAVLTACGSPTPASSPKRVTSTSAGTSSHAQAATLPVAGATLRTIDGTTVRVPSSKPSVLVFISISCADCSAAAKAVAKARTAVGDTATFLAVDLDPGVPARDLHGFLASVDAKNLPTMVDAKFGLLAKYNVSALSSVIVIDPAGKVTYRAINPSAGAITAAIAQST